MSDIIETIDHPYWGRLCRRAGYEGLEFERSEQLPDGGSAWVRFEFDCPDDKQVQANYEFIRDHWESLWPQILFHTLSLKTAYGYQDAPIQAFDWFSIRLEVEPIETGAQWSVMLQADEAGWLLDFEGLEHVGGQGVF